MGFVRHAAALTSRLLITNGAQSLARWQEYNFSCVACGRKRHASFHLPEKRSRSRSDGYFSVDTAVN